MIHMDYAGNKAEAFASNWEKSGYFYKAEKENGPPEGTVSVVFEFKVKFVT